ncbi:5'-methylthioadenosine/S-adenosylhomocysteine nucleosidase family protein [Sinomicrobium sp. M5D2P9]
MMITINEDNTYSLEDTLFVFALESEAGTAFNDTNKLITGIGKVNAAFELSKAIHRRKPRLIVNLGSAGSRHFRKGEVVCCTTFVQRDMDVRGLGYTLYETPLSGIPPLLAHGFGLNGLPEGICGTGDSFEMNHAAAEYNVVDMEAYPLALISMKEKIPFLCLKYISDGADGSAAEDWTVQVHKTSEVFRKILLPPGEQ